MSNKIQSNQSIARRLSVVGITTVLLSIVFVFTNFDLKVNAIGEPSLISVIPSSALSVGGDTITVIGSNFDSSTTVRIGSGVAIMTTLVDSSTLTFTLPASLYASIADVKVTNSTGRSATMIGAITYTITPPTLTSITPTQGPLTGNQAVTIKGSNFDQGKVAFKQVTAGESHSCGLTVLGKVYCWGYNYYGQLGNGTTTQSLTPIPVNIDGVLSGKVIVQIASGAGHTIALDSNGKIYAWGYNGYGKLGNNSTTNSSVPVEVDTGGILTGKFIAKITAGSNHNLATDSSGKVYSWGYNAHGELGNNSTTNSLVPIEVDMTGVLLDKNITEITAGNRHSIALDSDGKVYSWGYNSYGQLGDNTTTQRTSPVAVYATGALAGKTLVDVSAGNNHSIALDSNGAVYSWGYNSDSQLGDNSTTQRNAPVAVYTAGVLSGKVIKSIAAGSRHNIVIDSNNVVYTWGYNNYGQLGDNSTTQRSAPVAVYTTGLLNDKKITSIGAGDSHTLAIDSNNNTYAWGLNNYGQLGNNTTTQSLVPVVPTTVYDLPKITIDNLPLSNIAFTNSTTMTAFVPSHAAGLTDLKLTNYDGQSSSLANAYEYKTGPTLSSSSPTSGSIAGGDIVTISGTGFSALTKVTFAGVAISSTFINNTTIQVTVPSSVSSKTVDISIADEYNQTATLKNAYTYIAPGPSLTSITPVKGPTEGQKAVTITGSNIDAGKINFKQVAGGNMHSCGISTLNKVYCWGYNSNGQLGNNSTTQSTSPVLVDTSGVLAGKTVTSMTMGTNFTVALDSDGKLYAWGYNGHGELGNNSTTHSSVPVEVDMSGVLAGKTITKVVAGDYHVVALDSDGKTYTWGYNNVGQLGDNTIVAKTAPVEVNTEGALSGKVITSISAGYRYTIASDFYGKVYSWGYNNYGQLGNNSTTNSSIPIAVDTTGVLDNKTIVSVSAGHYHAVALDMAGKVYSWGYGNSGRLGNNSAVDSSIPVAVYASGNLSGKTIVSISAGQDHTTALDSTGKAYSWGLGNSYQLGVGSTATSSVPVAVNATAVLLNKTITSISSGYSHTLAVGSDNQVYAWGANGYGQLGDNSTSSRSLAVLGAIRYEIPTLTMGGAPFTNITVVNSTKVTATTPAHTAGLKDIKLTNNDDQSATLTNAYLYADAPTINSISPTTGLVAGGDTLTISGTDFTSLTTVKFGLTTVTPTLINANTIQIKVPSAVDPVSVDITVVDEFGRNFTLRGGLPIHFRYPLFYQSRQT